MSNLLWPIAVVLCFDIIVFSMAVFLVRLAAHDRQREIQELESEGQTAYEPPIVEAQPEQNVGQIPAMG